MTDVEKIISFIDEARDHCRERVKEIKDQKCVGFEYELGGLDELMYLKERILEEIVNV